MSDNMDWKPGKILNKLTERNSDGKYIENKGSPYKWNGGGPDWFLITCNTNEQRNEILGRLMNKSPRFTKFYSGTDESLIIQNRHIQRSKECARWFLGMFINTGIEVVSTEDDINYWSGIYEDNLSSKYDNE